MRFLGVVLGVAAIGGSAWFWHNTATIRPDLLERPEVQWGILVGILGGWIVLVISIGCCGLAYVKKRDARKANPVESTHIAG